MKLRAFARAMSLAAAILSAAACQYSPDIAQRTIAYNQSIAESTNDLFLLNAVRAASRQPTYYSRNEANTASSTLTPTVSTTFPWGGSPTLTSAALTNSNPVSSSTTGFLNATTVTKTLATAALTLTSSLTATESNQLTLANMDDQPSMYGLLAPITLQQIANYLNEGYNSQELYLLYMVNLSIPESVLHDLPNAIAENCAIKQKNRDIEGTGDLETERPTQDIYCEYFFGGATPTKYVAKTPDPYIAESTLTKGFVKFQSIDLVPGSLNPICFGYGRVASTIINDIAPNSPKDRWTQAEYESSPQNIIDSYVKEKGTAVTVPPPAPKMVTFSNDPALDGEPKAPSEHDMRYFTCFKQVLTALLALDFAPAQGPRKALYRLPMNLIQNNPRFFADLSQQGLEVAIVSQGSARSSAATGHTASLKAGSAAPRAIDEKISEFGVCKKPDDLSVTYTADAYVKALFESVDFKKSDKPIGPFSLEDGGGQGEASNTPVSGANSAIRSLSFQLSDAPGAIQLAPLPIESTKKAKHKNDCYAAVAAWQEKTSDKTQISISYTPRSLEAMVYFLGQIVRRDFDEQDGKQRVTGVGPVSFLNWRPIDPENPTPPFIYEEELFHAVKGTPTSDSIAQASDATGTYYVPKLCDDSTASNEGEPPERTSVKPREDGSECSMEYPNHASAQVLTLLNQIWGLNKTQTAAPIVPTVTVINPQ